MLKEKNNNLKVNNIMKQKMKQLILTLVALLAVTTGAWAQGKLIYEKDFSSDTYYPFYLDAADKTGASATVTDGLLVVNNPSIQTNNWDVQPEIGRLTSAAPITQGNTYRVVMQYKTTVAGSVTIVLGGQDWTNTDWKGQSITVSDDFQTCEGYFDSFPYSNSQSHILLQFGELVGTITIKKVEVYELYPVPLNWDATAKTATIASMPGGNVELEPEYYPQATLTAAPTAINDVPATTDGAIVKAGTVKNIGETTTAQGTVMYYVSTTALSDAALLALAADAWTADVPTAESLAQGQAYVYYYVRGNDGDTDETTFSDGDILSANALTVTIAAAPTYAVTFAEGTNPEAPAEPIWTASPNTGVTKGQTVTVTYTGTKKVLGVKAEKKAAAPATVLSGALVDGATIKVNFKWRGSNAGDYVQGTYNAASGTFTVSKGGDDWGDSMNDDRAVYKVEKSGDNIIIGACFNNFSDSEAMVWTFNTTNDTYTTTNGSMVNAHPDWYALISVTLNGTDITSQLTAQ